MIPVGLIVFICVSLALLSGLIPFENVVSKRSSLVFAVACLILSISFFFGSFEIAGFEVSFGLIATVVFIVLYCIKSVIKEPFNVMLIIVYSLAIQLIVFFVINQSVEKYFELYIYVACFMFAGVSMLDKSNFKSKLLAFMLSCIAFYFIVYSSGISEIRQLENYLLLTISIITVSAVLTPKKIEVAAK